MKDIGEATMNLPLIAIMHLRHSVHIRQSVVLNRNMANTKLIVHIFYIYLSTKPFAEKLSILL